MVKKVREGVEEYNKAFESGDELAQHTVVGRNAW